MSCPGFRSTCRKLRTATLEELQTATEKYVWPGHDEYDSLNDRKDIDPEPLPKLGQPKRIVLVRHGQSTWNAEGRIQGCCDLSVLTEKGKAQADTTRELVSLLLSLGQARLRHHLALRNLSKASTAPLLLCS